MIQNELRNTIKKMLKFTVPGFYHTLMAIRGRKAAGRSERKLGLPRVTQAFVQHYGATVLKGPFTGMTYVPSLLTRHITPKLLGSYESELHGVLDGIFESEYHQIVDIGCAEGYYAVGFAMRFPGVQVHAFDTDPLARKLCSEMAHANNVADQITVEGECKISWLSDRLSGKTLIFSDCEGGEEELLRPDLIPQLQKADIIVELHDWIVPNVTRILRERFVTSHEIILLDQTERRPSDYPLLDVLSVEERNLAINEYRPEGQQWAFMTPKAN